MAKSIKKSNKHNKLILCATTIISSLPLSVNLFLGKMLGLVLYRLRNRSKHVAYTNLKICFPGKKDAWLHQILKKSLIENSKTIFESFWLWKNSTYALSSLIGKIENEELLVQASDNNNSTIFITPHFGSWEFVGLFAASRCDIMILYARSKLSSMDEISHRGRSSTGACLVEATPSSMKDLVTHINRGGNIGILPDQVPLGNGGVYTTFFGRLAYTSTLACKLAKKHKCKIVIGYALRNEKQRFCYDIYCSAAPEEVYSNDVRVATRALNHFIEKCILTAPEQYLWVYKRFKQPAPHDSYPY